MGMLKKIWYWLSMDVTKGNSKDMVEYNKGEYSGSIQEYSNYSKTKGLRREGLKVKGGVNTAPTTPRPEFTPPPQNPARDFKREADEHFIQQQARREADDNFMLGAIVGGVIVDSLNDDNSHKAIEAEHIEPVYLFGNSEGGNNGSYSSSSNSDYIPSSSSSYDGGSYSSSSDSGSSSSCSCDSGC